MALFTISKSWTALSLVSPAALRKPISLKLVPINGAIGIKHASSKSDRIKELTINNLTKNLDLFTTSDVKVKLEHNSGRSVEPGTAKSLKLSSGVNSQKPMVIMLPWLMGKKKDVAKFASLYLQMGFEVLTCRMTLWQLLWPAKGTQLVASDLLQFLDLNAQNRPLLVHGFSAGGYLWGEMLALVEEKRNRFQPVLDNIMGTIWDSITEVQEISEGVPIALFPNSEFLQNACRKIVEYHMRKFYNEATYYYIRSSQVFNSSRVRSPALFFVSKKDPIGKPKSSKKAADNWKALGIDTRMKIWDDSPHVGHFRKYPDEYIAEISGFLAKVGLLPVASNAGTRM